MNTTPLSDVFPEALHVASAAAVVAVVSVPVVAPPVIREPLRVMFINTSLDVGGAETLQVDLVRRLDRHRFAPEICCIKDRGQLGRVMAEEVPLFDHLVSNKYDLRILFRLMRLLRRRRIDAVVTVGAGDKMFWGRLAARLAGVPVVTSALHSTGWPDGVGRLNRMLTRWTDQFIAVAEPHGRYLIEQEGFPAERVCVIPNGVDTNRFRPHRPDNVLRRQIGLTATGPVAGIVAALRPEKNHELFLQVAAGVRRQIPTAQFLMIGDGPRRAELEQLSAKLGVADCVHFLGIRADVPKLLGLVDVLLLTSHIEANPVSILEALACGKPVVATRVGSVAESVLDGENGYLVEPGSEDAMVRRVVELFRNPARAAALGAAGREHVVNRWSLDQMVRGYEILLEGLFEIKRPHAR
jgi:glycosyltransferase involved in cell wall biosynthesis